MRPRVVIQKDEQSIVVLSLKAKLLNLMRDGDVPFIIGNSGSQQAIHVNGSLHELKGLKTVRYIWRSLARVPQGKVLFM
ncbi:hypothetical protein Clacol_007863 [Clathrus columnatus]|uniref:Uncharacterized protein n=1 Tax=Clathrus columnatus TaxID=1419009 RepID=A0AAV5AG34_9AGAM|nr:hypothetical protein Clacol_007863 [Clathrus columnatus]